MLKWLGGGVLQVGLDVVRGCNGCKTGCGVILGNLGTGDRGVYQYSAGFPHYQPVMMMVMSMNRFNSVVKCW